MNRSLTIRLLPLLLPFIGGCVERTITVNSTPPGALVFLNDQEVGRTPLTRDFLWYGNYDVTVRADGYETIKTNYNVQAPIYQIVPLDLAAELSPFHFHDEKFLNYNMIPLKPVDPDQLLKNAREMKGELLPSEHPATRPTTKPAR